jgi:uncharacterized protein
MVHVLRLLAAGFALLGLLGSALAQQPVPVPPLSARVTDLTGTLSAPQRAQLETALADIEQRKGAQVAILMVPTTAPETIEAFGIRVAEAWKLGRGQARAQRDSGDKASGAIDDGVLILVAKDDRRVRIEVGYGLEGAIPDAVAKRIIGEAITPRFRAGDFQGGLQAAVADIGRRIEGEDLPAPWQPGPGDADAAGEAGLLSTILAAFLIGLVVSQVVGRLPGAAVGGGSAGLGAAKAFASGGLGLAVGLGWARMAFDAPGPLAQAICLRVDRGDRIGEHLVEPRQQQIPDGVPGQRTATAESVLDDGRPQPAVRTIRCQGRQRHSQITRRHDVELGTQPAR